MGQQAVTEQDGTRQTGQMARPVLELYNVTKRFPGVVANDKVKLVIHAGEIHVLLGENGAGKSTLVGMIAGLQQPDEGAILLDGRETVIRSPREAIGLGIGTVFQHSMLVPSLTVAENLVLGGPWWKPTDREGKAQALRELAASLGIAVDPGALAGDLSLGELQHVEILRALLRGSRVLVLDESTAMLTPQGIEDLGLLIRRLADRGIAVMLITHKLAEAQAWADRITVLRGGRNAGGFAPQDLLALPETDFTARVVAMMFGASAGGAEQDYRCTRRKPGAVMLSVSDMAAQQGGTAVAAISLDVAEGEILGIAGIDGNGQKQLAEAIAGQIPATGTIRLGGTEIGGLDVGARHRAGLRYVTDDRMGEGSVRGMSVAMNLVTKETGSPQWWPRGVEDGTAILAHGRDLVDRFDVRPRNATAQIGKLSGGNIQKVLLARELTGEARAVVFSKPTYGLDLSNVQATRQRIADTAGAGVAVVLISTDLDEILAMSDRIAVMVAGRIVGITPNDDRARSRIARLMLGTTPGMQPTTDGATTAGATGMRETEVAGK